MKLPDLECFGRTESLAIDYSKEYRKSTKALFRHFTNNFQTVGADEFFQKIEKVRLKVLKNIRDKYLSKDYVLAWFEMQPAFRVAFPEDRKYSFTNDKRSGQTKAITDLMFKLKFRLQPAYPIRMRDNPSESFEEKYSNQFDSLKDLYIKIEESYANDFIYLSIVSELSRMSLWYITDTYLEQITTAKDRIEKIAKLIIELHDQVDLLTNSKWYPENIEKMTLPAMDIESNKKISVELLRNIVKTDLSVVKNKNSTVQERLMIVDLIRMYKRVTGDYLDKRAIYDLMGLPFLEKGRDIDFRTIERILKEEKDRNLTCQG